MHINLAFYRLIGSQNKDDGLYGRNLTNAGCYNHAPHDHWATAMMIDSVKLSGKITSLAIQGGARGYVFREYARQILIPTLTRGNIVIADNLNAHKNQKAKELIESTEAHVIFLPSYSLDLNPIKKCGAQ